MALIRIFVLIALLAAAVFAQVPAVGTEVNAGSCPQPEDIYINCGGDETSDCYRADSWTTSTHKFSTPNAIAGATGCTDQYKSHASTFAGDLVYKIPVSEGSFKVTLMFAENYDKIKVGDREFTLNVNGKSLTNGAKTTFDILALTGGLYTPFVTSTTVSAVNGSIIITVGRIAGKNNPMMSGIIVSSPGATNASDIVGTKGLTGSCADDDFIAPKGVAQCPPVGTEDIYINLGGSFTTEGWRCEVKNLWRSGDYSYSRPARAVKTTEKGCLDVYQSHASTFSGDLVFDIPVPNGAYTVKLLFNDNVPDNKLVRKFKIRVNGKELSVNGSTTFDIIQLAGGIDRPYIAETSTTSTNKKILIEIVRIPGQENPFISGLIISGDRASDLITNSGQGNCIAGEEEPDVSSEPIDIVESPTPNPAPSPTDDDMACPAVTGETNAFINAGGSFTSNGYRCDVNGLWRPGTAGYVTTRPVKTTATGCVDQYKSHAYVNTGDLVYTIPVAAGEYKVDLMFMENYAPHVVGSRKFTVNVNGAGLSPAGTTGTEFDIVALAGGVDIPYVVSTTTTATAAGITITIGRLPTANNPMVSGIVISGTGATASMGTSGVGNCIADPSGETTSPPPDNEGVGRCPEPDDVYVNAGGENLAGGSRCDIPNKWASPNKINYAVTRPVDTTETGGCFEQYKTSSWTQTGDLVYTVPVPAGPYTVYLGFMEIVPSATKGYRLFTININGQGVPVEGNTNVDIFDLAGGVDKPYLVSHDTTAVGGEIKITLGRTAANNPFLSFISISGNEAASLVGTAGLQSCVEISGNPCNDEDLNKPVPEFTDAHTAHAVSGGPYVATDFAGSGKVKVDLDGLQSHSHGQDAQGNSVPITDWIWTYQDPAAGKVTLVGPTPAPEFPVGTFPISLQVRDGQCDRAMDTTTITINPARTEGAYCYFYDYIDSLSEMVPLAADITQGKLPEYAKQVEDIDYANAAAFSTVPFKENSFAVRCVFSFESKQVETKSYKVMHSGPIKVYTDGVMVAESTSYNLGATTNIPSKSYSVGIHKFQVLYFRPKSLAGQLKFLQSNNQLVGAGDYGYDASMVLPVITSSSTTGTAAGNVIKIFGSGFFNGVTVNFGIVPGQTNDVMADEISVEVPAQAPGIFSVLVTVKTNAGLSNDFTFEYPTVGTCKTVNWQTTSLKAKSGPGDYVRQNIISIRYGPDGRLYAGTSKEAVVVMDLDKNLKVINDWEKSLGNSNRLVLGLAFNPATTALKLYATTATIYWKGKIANFADGWTNGKVQTVTALPGGGFNNDVSDLVTGLPVTNHDHTPSWIQFLPDGTMLVSIGGFTNGGISEPGDKLGGVPPAPFAGSIIECPSTGLTAITYTNPNNPDQAEVIGTDGCKIYAPGFRNSFGGYFATNGELYATDNGPNPTYGDFSTDCTGGKVVGTWFADLLHKVQKGKCHGHPHIPRALATNDPAQCVFKSALCVQPLWNGAPPSTNGIVEYRSNVFDGEFKGNLIMTKFSGQSDGAMHRVILDENTGNIKAGGIFKDWHGFSGLRAVEGPRGEIIMNRYQKDTFYVRKPVCDPMPQTMYLIGVHPKRGPAAGGHKVLISGYNFGTNPMAKFGTEPCTDVNVIDDTQFTCVTPAGTPNTQVKVEIMGPGGETNTATTGADYWYW